MKYKIKKDVLWKTVDDEVVIVDLKKDDYCSLNSTATEFWKLLDKGRALEEIIGELAGKYGEKESKIKSDISKLAADLVSAGLIEEE